MDLYKVTLRIAVCWPWSYIEIAFDHVTQRQHHVHSMAANCEMFSMSPIKVLISNYLEHISSVS